MRVLLDEKQRIAQLPFGVILILAPPNRLVHLQPLVRAPHANRGYMAGSALVAKRIAQRSRISLQCSLNGLLGVGSLGLGRSQQQVQYWLDGRPLTSQGTVRSNASNTLDAARLFVEQAISAADRGDAFRYNLEAAIVFGRSVTFHIQKQFSHCPGFEDWYATWQTRLGENSTCKYFRDKRNFVLKEGRVTFHHTLQVDSVVIATSFSDVTLTVHRADGTVESPPPSPPRPRPTPPPPKRSAPPTTGFTDFRPTENATTVLLEYLDFLKPLVEDAEGRFENCAPAV